MGAGMASAWNVRASAGMGTSAWDVGSHTRVGAWGDVGAVQGRGDSCSGAGGSPGGQACGQGSSVLTCANTGSIPSATCCL